MKVAVLGAGSIARSMAKTLRGMKTHGRPVECPEMPHAETLHMMRVMDALRAQWGMRYPFD